MAVFQTRCRFEFGYPIMREWVADSVEVMAALPCVLWRILKWETGRLIAPVYYSKILKYTLILKIYRFFLNSIGSATVADVVYKCFLAAITVSVWGLKLCWVWIGHVWLYNRLSTQNFTKSRNQPHTWTASAWRSLVFSLQYIAVIMISKGRKKNLLSIMW